MNISHLLILLLGNGRLYCFWCVAITNKFVINVSLQISNVFFSRLHARNGVQFICMWSTGNWTKHAVNAKQLLNYSAVSHPNFSWFWIVFVWIVLTQDFTNLPTLSLTLPWRLGEHWDPPVLVSQAVMAGIHISSVSYPSKSLYLTVSPSPPKSLHRLLFSPAMLTSSSSKGCCSFFRLEFHSC